MIRNDSVPKENMVSDGNDGDRSDILHQKNFVARLCDRLSPKTAIMCKARTTTKKAARSVKLDSQTFPRNSAPSPIPITTHTQEQPLYPGTETSLQTSSNKGVRKNSYDKETIENVSVKISKQLGISVYALRHVLLPEVKEAGLEETATIYKLKDPVIKRKGAGKICPRDGKVGAAYVDCIEGIDQVGPAEYYLSYMWRYSIGDIIETLELYCKQNKRDIKSTYVWICCVCNNEHRHNGIGMGSTYIHKLADRIKSMKNGVIAMMTPWDKPECLTRVWCLFDLYAAHVERRECTLIMPPRDNEKFHKAVEQGDVNDFFTSLFKIDVETAEASNEEEKTMILNTIKDEYGFEEFNLIASDMVAKYLVRCYMRNEEVATETSPAVYAKISQQTISDCDNESNHYTPTDSELQGVSVHYLSTKFMQEVRDAGCDESSNIYDIEKKVIMQKGEGITCPLQQSVSGAAYVHCLDVDDVGKSTIMLSYAWQYQIGDIIDTLVRHCDYEGLDLKRTYVWICCLCVNQYQVKEQREQGADVPFETFRATFESRVKSINHIMPIMAPWDKPTYLTRVWCIFEMFTASAEGCRISIAMPKTEKDKFVKGVEQSQVNNFFKVLAEMDVKKAGFTVEADRNNIFALIENGPGYDELNLTVIDLVATYLVRCAREKQPAN